MSRERGTTTTNNIWISKNKDTVNYARVTSLACFQPRQIKNVCVTLREWAAYIFKCEFEPKSLDASSKEILNRQDLMTKKYNMLRDDLTWGKLHTEEKSNSKAKTPMVVSTMDEEELYLNVCQAMKANASNTKKKHDNVVNTETIMVLVEIVNRKFKRECIDLKEVIKYLTQAQTAKLFEHEEEEEDDEDEDGSIHVDDKNNLSSGSFSSSNDSSSSDGSSSSSDDATSSANTSKD